MRILISEAVQEINNRQSAIRNRLVLPPGNAPGSSAYRAGSLLLSYGRDGKIGRKVINRPDLSRQSSNLLSHQRYQKKFMSKKESVIEFSKRAGLLFASRYRNCFLQRQSGTASPLAHTPQNANATTSGLLPITKKKSPDPTIGNARRIKLYPAPIAARKVGLTYLRLVPE